MKRCLALMLSIAMLCTTAVWAAASSGSWVSETNVYPGSTVTVSGFYDKDGGELDESQLDTEYYTVSIKPSKNGEYVERVYIDNNNSEVKLVIKSGIKVSSAKDIIGSVTVRDRDNGKRYTAEIEEGMLVLGGGGTANMEYVGHESFELPDSYQSNKVKFKTEDGDSYGTLRADFVDSSYRSIAYFNVLVVDQSTLYLGHNNTPDLNLMKKYSDADIRFITWSAAPTFDATGTLGIMMDSDEYIYGRKADGSLYKLSGKYNSDTGAYEIKTKTLGSYVISNKALSAGGAVSSSSSVPASSSVAPSSSSVAPPPASSSAPASSSSVPASSSSVAESSSSLPESSEPVSESSEAEAPESSESSSAPVVAPTDSDKEDGGFPVIPVIIGVLAVVVIALGIFLFAGNKKKRGYDSWDD